MANDEGYASSLHYEEYHEVPKEIRKYWQQRYSIFSKYDEGILLNHAAWFGVTPEPVANRIALDLGIAAPAHKTVLIDVFGGAGGNAIAFALSGRWEQIFAIEKDEETLKCAKHNAEIYGVAKKIWWIKGDCFDMLKARFKGMGDKAVIFASPPWGGPSYTGDQVFDLSRMEPYSVDALYRGFSKITPEIALYLPRNSNLNQLAKYAQADRQMSVIHYCMNGASKALCAYLGDFQHLDSNESEDRTGQ